MLNQLRVVLLFHKMMKPILPIHQLDAQTDLHEPKSEIVPLKSCALNNIQLDAKMELAKKVILNATRNLIVVSD